jgi:hypothetical protein
MKRLLVLIIALLVLSDLAEDGCLDPGLFVMPHRPEQADTVSASPQSSDQALEAFSCAKVAHHSRRIDLQLSSLPSLLLEIPPPLQGQSVTTGVQLNLKIIYSCHTSSSGGISL